MNNHVSSLHHLIDYVASAALQEHANRSRLDSQALLYHARRINHRQITEELNQVYQQHRSALHPSWRLVQPLSTR